MENTPQPQAAEASAPSSVTTTSSSEVFSAPNISTSEAPVEHVISESTESATSTPSDTGSESILGDSANQPKDVSNIDQKESIKTESEVKKDAPLEESASDNPDAVTPSYEFKLPENVALDKEPLDAFTKILSEIETSKLDHDGLQQSGQKLIDMHIKGINDSIQRLNDYYVQIHEQQKNDWLNAFKKDPEIGGENLPETVSNLRSAVENYAGNEAQTQEFRDLMKTTGVGNHPALIRLLNNMDAQIRKFTTEGDANANGTRIVPASRPAPSKVKDYQRFYGN